MKYEVPSGDLHQPGIPSGDSFYSKLKYEAPSGDLLWPIRDPFWRSSLIKNQKNLFCKSVNLESHLAISFYRLLDVVLHDGRVWKLLSSLLIVLESTQWFFLRLQFYWNVLRSPPVMTQKTYMQWFMIRCHACIRTWFWNIGPINLLLVHETLSSHELAFGVVCWIHFSCCLFLPIISWRRSLRLFTSSLFFSQNVWLFIASLSCFCQMLYLFQIYGLSSRFENM